MNADQAFFRSLKWKLVNLKIETKMVIITLARWMWFVDIVKEKGFKQRSKTISQIQIRRSCLILEAFVARGILPKAQKPTIYLNDWSICISYYILKERKICLFVSCCHDCPPSNESGSSRDSSLLQELGGTVSRYSNTTETLL